MAVKVVTRDDETVVLVKASSVSTDSGVLTATDSRGNSVGVFNEPSWKSAVHVADNEIPPLDINGALFHVVNVIRGRDDKGAFIDYTIRERY